MDGYKTGTENDPEEEEEGKHLEGNRKQPETNTIGGSHSWGKEIAERARSEKGGTWPGMKRNYQTNQKRRKKNNMGR